MSEPSRDELPWWARRPRARRGPEPWSHASRLVAYEVYVILTTAVAATVLAFIGFRGQFLDLYTRMHQGAPVSEEVVLVTIGSEALYLWNSDEPEPEVTPRGLLAEVVQFLDAAGANVIVLDFLLDRPTSSDEKLAKAAAQHGAVLLAERYQLAEPGTGVEFVAGTTPELVESTVQGLANFQLESPTVFSGESVVRRVPLVRRVARAHLSGIFPANLVGARMSDAEVLPSMGLGAVWLHRARQADPKASYDTLLKTLDSQCSGHPLRCESSPADLHVAGLPHAVHEPLHINYRGSERGDRLPTVRAAEILRLMAEPALLADLGVASEVPVPDRYKQLFDGKIAVVGRVDGSDHLLTPYAFPMYLRPDMAGPRIQAQVIDTLASGRHVRFVPGIFGWLLAAALGVGVVRSARFLRDDVHGLLWIAVSGGLAVLGLGLFIATDGLVFELGLPLGACLGMVFLTQLRAWAEFDVGVGLESGDEAS